MIIVNWLDYFIIYWKLNIEILVVDLVLVDLNLVRPQVVAVNELDHTHWSIWNDWSMMTLH